MVKPSWVRSYGFGLSGAMTLGMMNRFTVDELNEFTMRRLFATRRVASDFTVRVIGGEEMIF